MKKCISVLFMHLLSVLLLGAVIICYVHFTNPYKSKNILLLDNWTYFTDISPENRSIHKLNDYSKLEPNETMILTRKMTEQIENPALMITLWHQRARVFLNEQLLFENTEPSGRNPGISLHFIPLPENYIGQELRIEGSSPYAEYAYAPNPIYIGDIPSLEAFDMGRSAYKILFLFLTVISGVLFLLFSVVLSLHRPSEIQWGNFAFSAFSITLGLSTVVSLWEGGSIFLQFFSPLAVSNYSLAMWLIYPIPLLFYFYEHFMFYKKHFMFLFWVFFMAVVFVFATTAAGAWDLPDTLIFMNPVYIITMFVLSVFIVLEFAHKNPMVRFISPAILLLAIAAVSAAVDFAGLYSLLELCRSFGFILLIVLIWIYQLKNFFVTRRKEHEEMNILKLKNKLVMENYEIINGYIKETNLLRHEFNHHIAALQVLNEQKDFKKLAEYLNIISKSAGSAESFVYCENPLINSILGRSAKEAETHHIAFRCEANVPKALPFAESDLCSLLMNLLDNAMEACLKLTENERWVNIQIKTKENFLVISCENAKHEQPLLNENGRVLSTKADKNAHGYGLLVINGILKKYDSKLNISYDEKTFSAKTILRLSDMIQI